MDDGGLQTNPLHTQIILDQLRCRLGSVQAIYGIAAI